MNAILACLMFLASSIALGQASEMPIAGLWEQISFWSNVVSQVTFILMIVATFAVRFMPGKDNITKLDTTVGKIMKWLSWLPTIGINPRTKALEAALEDLRKQIPAAPAPTSVEVPK